MAVTRKELGALFIATITGAGLMYFLDPRLGRRRRAIIRDKAIHLSRKTNEVLAS